jgi:hypothetical protein
LKEPILQLSTGGLDLILENHWPGSYQMVPQLNESNERVTGFKVILIGARRKYCCVPANVIRVTSHL